MLSYPLDLATILYVLRGQSGRLHATVEEIPGARAPCRASLVLVVGKVTSSVLETSQGALLAQGARAMHLLAELDSINWIWEPGWNPDLSRPSEPSPGKTAFIPQRGEPFKLEALRDCSRIQRRVLGLVDGRRTVQEIATLLAVPPAECERLLAVLQELQAMGLIALG
jgi:hypothetical protein